MLPTHEKPPPPPSRQDDFIPWSESVAAESLRLRDFNTWPEGVRAAWLRHTNFLLDREKHLWGPLETWAVRDRLKKWWANLVATKDEIELAVRAAGATSEAFPAAPPFGRSVRPSPEAACSLDLENGAAGYLAESDDTPGFEPAEQRPSYLFAQRVQEDFFQRLVDQTGIVDDPKPKAQRDAEKEKVRAMSHSIAVALESQGIEAYRNTAWSTWRVLAHSLEVEALPPFRNICLLPYMAARNRQRTVAAVEWFLQEHPFCRHVVFTSGPRCPVGQVGGRLAEMHRRISLLNAQRFMQKAGAEIVLRSSELGKVEPAGGAWEPHAGTIERGVDGGRLYHVHCHCVMFMSRGPIPAIEWRGVEAHGADGSTITLTPGLLQKIKKFWRHHWHEDGLIYNPRELCKYVTKPGDMVALAHEKPAELAELARQLLGVHMVQPLGTLRNEITGRRGAGMELAKRPTRDGMVWEWIRSPNRSFCSDARKTRWKRADDLSAEGVALRGWDPLFCHGAADTAPRLRPPVEQYASEAMVKRYWQADHYGPLETGTARRAVCKLASVGMPRSGSSCVREPVLIVIGNRLDLQELLRDPIAQAVRAATFNDWRAGQELAKAAGTAGAYRTALDAARQAERIKVHTGTTTVDGPPLAVLWDVPERPKPAAAPVWTV